MTPLDLATILASAKLVLRGGPSPELDAELVKYYATWLIDTLGEAQPCMIEKPRIVSFGDGTRGVMLDEPVQKDPLTPQEIRAYCAMLLRCADEAEG